MKPLRLLSVVLALSCVSALGQTVGPVSQPHVTFVDGGGFPCVGCSLYTYAAGTTTPLATYKNSTLTANANPIILDASGGAFIWTLAGPYKFILKDAGGATLWTVDNVQGLPTDTTARTSATAAQASATSAQATASSAATAAAAAQVTANAALPAFGMTTSQGTGTKVQHSTGTATTDHIVKFDSVGNTVDSGITYSSVVQSVLNCGTTATCANSAQTSPRTVWGVVTLAAGTATITGISPAFTGLISFSCTATDYTAANAVKVAIVSTSSITITGTATDQVTYVCVGN